MAIPLGRIDAISNASETLKPLSTTTVQSGGVMDGYPDRHLHRLACRSHDRSSFGASRQMRFMAARACNKSVVRDFYVLRSE
jgi:hypothetical protein